MKLRVYFTRYRIGVRFERTERTFFVWIRSGNGWAIFSRAPSEAAPIRPLFGVVHPQKSDFVTRRDDEFLVKVGLFGKWYKVREDG